MELLKQIPTWLFSIAIGMFVLLLCYLAITGKEFWYKDSFRFSDPKLSGTILKKEEIKKIIDEQNSKIEKIETNLQLKSYASLPLGSIIPFFGDLNSLKGTDWIECDGGDIPIDSKLKIDADPQKGGSQLPDLRGRFIQGLDAGESLFTESKALHTGGHDTINLSHNHEWAHFTSLKWQSFDANGGLFLVREYNDGIGIEGAGEYPLSRKDNDTIKFYTDKKCKADEDNRPRYLKLHFIIRIR